MEARVKQDARYPNITAFSGREYVKYEYRLVPAGCEEECLRNQYLEAKAEAAPKKAAKVAKAQEAAEGAE